MKSSRKGGDQAGRLIIEIKISRRRHPPFPERGKNKKWRGGVKGKTMKSKLSSEKAYVPIFSYLLRFDFYLSHKDANDEIHGNDKTSTHTKLS